MRYALHTSPHSIRLLIHVLGLAVSVCAHHWQVAGSVPTFIQHHLWRPTTRCLRYFRILLAYHHASPVQIYGCPNALVPGSCLDRAILRFPGHLATHHVHSDGRRLEFVTSINAFAVRS